MFKRVRGGIHRQLRVLREGEEVKPSGFEVDKAVKVKVVKDLLERFIDDAFKKWDEDHAVEAKEKR